jgi:hypothetical protein
MKTPAETALEFCRKCLVWPYADTSAASPSLIFEDLDPAVKANTLDFTSLSAVITAATSTMPPGYTLNISAGKSGMFMATIENEAADPPIVLADQPAEDTDLRVAIMEACLEASRKLRGVVREHLTLNEW